MADTKLADLTSGTAEATDIIYAVKDPSGTPLDRKLTLASVKTLVNTPGGSDTQVQFNDGGAFGGNSAMTFNKTTGAFSASTVTASATTANTSAISATSYSVTGSSSANMVDLSGTWNTSGSPTGIKLNLTNTASASTSNLMDLQIGGASRFRVDRDGDLILGGATLTANSPVLDATQTWNAGGVTFTGMKLNVTDTASAAASLLMDLQVGGSSKFYIGKTGRANVYDLNCWDGDLLIYRAGGAAARIGTLASNFPAIGLGTNVSVPDLFLTRRAAANLRLGAADAAAPVAQTLSVQSVVAGTSNTAGADLTITGSQGTGTGAGGSIIFQVAPAGSSGTAQNALATALTITASRTLVLNGGVAGSITLSVSSGRLLSSGTLEAPGLLFGSGWGSLTGSSAGAVLSQTGAATGGITLSPGTGGSFVEVRNGTNAQTFRVYSTFTDASNYERGALNAGADFIELAAETAGTGDDNLDVRLTPAGTGNVRFGTHSAVGSETVTGFITIKDAGGTLRKLAVIS